MEEPEIGEWLDPERTIRSYYLPNRVIISFKRNITSFQLLTLIQAPLRYQLKPKVLNIQYQAPPKFEGTPPTIPSPVRVSFYAPIGGVLEKLGIPLEGSGIYLLNESTGRLLYLCSYLLNNNKLTSNVGNQYLDTNLSLFNQNVPENSTIIIQPATKGLI